GRRAKLRDFRRRHPEEAHHRDRRERPLAGEVRSRPQSLTLPRNFARPAMLSQRPYYLRRRSAMAQVITRCRLTGHYMFMGMDVDPKEFTRSPGPFNTQILPVLRLRSLVAQGGLEVFGAQGRTAVPYSTSELIATGARRSQRRSGSHSEGIAFATLIHH